MEWSRVEISRDNGSDNNFNDSLTSPAGLDTDAQASHQRFINDVPHLEDVMQMHGRTIGKGILFSSANKHNLAISSFDDAITNLGAIPSESGLEIPINSNLTEDVILEVATISEGQVIRLIATEQFGGISETFSLPIGSKLAGAIWNGRSLKIDYKF